MDEHWRPSYFHCSVCEIDYQDILHLETVEEEEHFLKAKLSPNFQQSFHENHKEEGLSSKEITEIYFEILSDQEIQKLYEVYKLDFLIFGYEFQIRDLKFP